LLGHEHPVQALAFDADGRHLASSDSVTLRVWDIAEANDPFTLQQHTNGVDGLALSPDGRVLVSVGGEIRLWDAHSFRSLGVLHPETERGWASSIVISYSFDGATLVLTTRRDGEVLIPLGHLLADTPEANRGPLPKRGGDPPYRIDDAAKPHSVRLLKGDAVVHDWPVFVRSAALSPDGRRIAIADMTISIYDTETGTLVRTLPGLPVKTFALAYSPDGTRLASGSDDRVIRLWDLEAKTEVMQLRGHLDRITDLLFTPDGKTLFTSSGDGTVRAWTTRTVREKLTDNARADSR
jgi:WD40 repeat protein